MLTNQMILATSLKHSLTLWWANAEAALLESKTQNDPGRTFTIRSSMEARRHPSTVFGVLSEDDLAGLISLQALCDDKTNDYLVTHKLYVMSSPEAFFLTDDMCFGGEYLFGPDAIEPGWKLEAYDWPLKTLKGGTISAEEFCWSYSKRRRHLRNVPEIVQHLNNHRGGAQIGKTA